jgi:hypothetical protein
MTPRRLIVAAFVAGSALLAAAPSARADTPRGGWTDPKPSSQAEGLPVAVAAAAQPLRGVAEFSQGIAAVRFQLKEDAANAGEPCSAVTGVQPQNKAYGGSTRVEFAFDAAFPCNRRYKVGATVTPVQKPLRQDSDLTLDLFVDVAIPPAATTGVQADVAGRRVTLRWDDAGHEPDFEGFAIRRATGSGSFAELAELGADATTYTDSAVPPAGGTLRYRVVGFRSGPQAGTVVYGPDGSTAEATVVPLPGETTTTTSKDGSSSSGGTDTGASGTAAGAGTAPTGQGTSSARRVFQAPGPETATTLDTGYTEALPFGSKPAPSALPGDSSAVARFDDGSGDDGKRQTFLLVAGGTTAFSWAMVLRYVSRRAAGF